MITSDEKQTTFIQKSVASSKKLSASYPKTDDKHSFYKARQQKSLSKSKKKEF
ncbi:hypothetical protein CCYN49044_200085 [Capnocytophaga cynodegmi]|uniref:Uncharacterized protein n=1 Tax=Capnocytophaga cynodegmi TaxID=28189 RepID=A0A0B7H4D2_9FLAO|nr:hypothetical protein CCYN74_100085 [Capnocytophaga cynodegmi]CEN37908.1 hypothetical protein CCYN49044_200085 [Capnocytophaga cynodegmi]